MTNEGLERFARLETRILTGEASPEELERYRTVLSLAHGECGGIIPRLREIIDSDRGMIEMFPVLMNSPESILDGTAVRVFDEHLYDVRRQGMLALLSDLERILIGDLA